MLGHVLYTLGPPLPPLEWPLLEEQGWLLAPLTPQVGPPQTAAAQQQQQSGAVGQHGLSASVPLIPGSITGGCPCWAALQSGCSVVLQKIPPLENLLMWK